ncbi:MAG TPA: AMP-binding protein [Chthoniobacterales bacterium]
MRDSLVPVRRHLEISRQPAGSPFHTSQVSISFGETIEAGALRAAWELIAQAHPALRRKFDAAGGVTDTANPAFVWNERNWQTGAPADLGAEWQTLVQTDAATPIAVGEEPTCRITFIVLPNGHGHALWSFHAALLDNDSISAALHRWLHAYDCLRTGADAPEFESSAESAEAEAELATPEDFVPPRPLIVLPLPDPAITAGTRRSVSQTFERPERREFVAAAKKLGGSLSALFGSAWAFVLARATSSDEALLLETSRPPEGLGRFETFTLRRRPVESHATARDLVHAFAEISELPLPPADTLVSAYIFREHTLNDRLQLEVPRWMAADTQLFQKTAPPLALRVVASDRPEVALDYDSALLSDAAARTLFDAFLGTLAAFVADPRLELATLALPGTPAEVETPDVPGAFRSLVIVQGIHETFADAAAESPDAIAVEMDEETLTFAQLNNSANQVARLLRKRGVQAGARIGVAMPRSPRWVVALLGALKAGGVIVPLSPETGEADVDAWIVDALPEGEARPKPVVQMIADAGALSNEKARGVQTDAKADPQALVALVDGKPHTFTHEVLARALQSLAGLLALEPADRVLQFAPTGTFPAVEETLASLLSGATLVLRSGDRWPTRTAFQEFVQEKNITALTIPVAFWTQWTHYLTELSLTVPASLRLAATTGSLAAPNAVLAWRAVAGSTHWLHRVTSSVTGGLGLGSDWSAEDSLAACSLGRPTPAAVARIVDRHGLALPLGLAGTVEVAPARSPDKPATLGIEAFVSPEGIFYDRTALQELVVGPIGQGAAETIRHVAITHPGVLDAHVEQRLIAARQEWCLWIVPRDSERGEPHDLREWLTARLPAAPRRIRALPRFPLDDAGNLDVAALVEQLPDDVATPAARKGTEAEERVRQAISRALGGRRIELDEILTDGRTKPQVAKLLFEAVLRDEPRVELADFTTGFSVRSLLRNVRGRGRAAGTPAAAAPVSAWTPIQPLRASGKLPPLVFIHDFDGTSKGYAPLVAQLGEDQPCYAITARGLADPDASHATVEEMARAYVEALRVFDATGPYRLLGYGFGGLVAFEMARQLSAAGASVPLLVGLATEPPATNSAAAFLAGGWKRSLASLLGRKTEETPRRRRTSESPISRVNEEAARKYSPPASALAAHIFVPEQNFPPFRVVEIGWTATCRDAQFYQVPCSGPEMMDEPAVEAIANAITKLARAEELDTELENED